MRNASGHNYWNSSFIMDVAMGYGYHVPQNEFLVKFDNIHSLSVKYIAYISSNTVNCLILITDQLLA